MNGRISSGHAACHSSVRVMAHASFRLVDPPFHSGVCNEWQNLFSNSSQRWDNRRDKRSPRDQALWLDNQYRSQWVVDSMLPSLDANHQQHHHQHYQHQHHQVVMEHPSFLRLHREVKSLCDQGQLDRALDVLLLMDQQEGSAPPEKLYWSLLKACNKKKDLTEAKKMKAHFAVQWSTASTSLAEYLVITLAKCGGLEDGLHVFHMLPRRTVFSWTAIISAYADCGKCQEALNMYKLMQKEGVEPNEYTFVSLLKACGFMLDLQVGKEMHADAQRRGLDSSVFVGNTLVSMYSKCGSIVEAENVFYGLSERNTVSWNAMLTAYVERGEGERALQIYRQIQEECVSVDAWTIVAALQACCIVSEKERAILVEGRVAKVRSLETGQMLHDEVAKRGFHTDGFVSNSLVHMYGKCGSIEDAENVFHGLCERDIVSWTAMLSVFVEQGQGEKALELYTQMLQDGVALDDVTLVWLLQACGNTGSMEVCRQIHYTIVAAGYELSNFLATTLIHVYGSCASMVDAHAIFDALPQPDVVCWSTLLAGYTREGECVATLKNFQEMLLAGTKPDEVAFLSVLSACSHIGLVENGVEYFKCMSTEYGVTPAIEHYVTMVDLLGRAGDFTRVEAMLSRMLVQPDLDLWLSLLSACGQHGEVELGKQVFNHAVHLQPKQASAYILMSNIYVEACLQDCVNQLDKSGQGECEWKAPAQS